MCGALAHHVRTISTMIERGRMDSY